MFGKQGYLVEFSPVAHQAQIPICPRILELQKAIFLFNKPLPKKSRHLFR